MKKRVKNKKKFNFLTNFSNSSYGRHGVTTQIHSLPGGVKREIRDIKDDGNHVRKNSASFLFKLEKDYNNPNNNEFLTFVNFFIFIFYLLIKERA